MNVDGHARRQEKNLPLLDEIVFVLMVVIGVLDDLKEGCRTVVATEAASQATARTPSA